MSQIVIPPKAQAATQTILFDFLSQLQTGETVSSAATTATVWSGNDSTPSAVISSVSITAPSQVYQKVTGGVEGTIYLLTCQAQTSLGNSPIIQTYLAIVSTP